MQMRNIARSLLIVVLALFASGLFAGRAQAQRSWPTLSSGSSGENVYTLQAKLRHRGYTVSYNGVYDSSTVTAVQQFEGNNSIPADGVADPAVWEQLVVTVRQGDSNIVVEALQRQLRNRYGYTKTVTSADQVFGPATNRAAVSFQKSVNLTADGIVGPDTWSRLTSGDSARIRHSTAVQQLQNASITVTSSSGSAGVGQDRELDKTSLEQIRSLTTQRLIEFKQASGCTITVTGGTETWIHSSGSQSHHTGYKIDISRTTCVTNYITSNYTRIDSTHYRDARGNIYFDEADHWDILYSA